MTSETLDRSADYVSVAIQVPAIYPNIGPGSEKLFLWVECLIKNFLH